MNGGLVQCAGSGSRLQQHPGLAYVPIIVMRLKAGQLRIGSASQVWRWVGLNPLGSNPIDAAAVGKLHGVTADVGVVPIQNVYSTIRPDLYAEANPCQIIGRKTSVNTACSWMLHMNNRSR